MSEHRTFGFKRPWRAPRAVLKGATLERLTARGEWLRSYSRLRAMDNPDVVIYDEMPAEFGSWSSFRFITSEHL